MCRGIKRSHSKSEIWDSKSNKSQEISIFSPSKSSALFPNSSNVEVKVTASVSIVNDEYLLHLNANESNDSHNETYTDQQTNVNGAKYIGERKRFEDVTNFPCSQDNLVTSDKKLNPIQSVSVHKFNTYF